jgi:hypothetical protein
MHILLSIERDEAWADDCAGMRAAWWNVLRSNKKAPLSGAYGLRGTVMFERSSDFVTAPDLAKVKGIRRLAKTLGALDIPRQSCSWPCRRFFTRPFVIGRRSQST